MKWFQSTGHAAGVMTQRSVSLRLMYTSSRSETTRYCCMQETGRHPVTNDDLKKEDLIPLQSNKVQRGQQSICEWLNRPDSCF